METLYKVADTSRQAFHYWLRPSIKQQTRVAGKLVVEMAKQVREKFLPGSSAREIYFYIRKKHELYNSLLLGWGKHSFEAICLANGLRVVTKRFVPKTTIHGDFTFPNRIEGLEINNINQIWASDICYLFGSNGILVGYATSLIDLYSRRLLGLSFSKSMHAEVTSKDVLRQAFEVRKMEEFSNLFFHSDGGRQYIETAFLAALRKKNIKSSMAKSCYENAFAEAFNDILKNHILFDLDVNSFHQLKSYEKFIKHCYNFNRVHNGIQKKTPVEYEQLISSLNQSDRNKMKIKVISQ